MKRFCLLFFTIEQSKKCVVLCLAVFLVCIGMAGYADASKILYYHVMSGIHGKEGTKEAIQALTAWLKGPDTSDVPTDTSTKVDLADTPTNTMQSLYLPLAKGNRWRYKITVPKGGEYILRRRIIFPKAGSDAFVKTMRLGRREEGGTYSLEFVMEKDYVVKAGDILCWEISARGDFVFAKSIYWNWSKTTGLKFEVVLLTADATQYFPATLGRHICPRVLLYDPLNRRPEVEKDPIELYMGNLGVKYSFADSLSHVSVPAGDFSDCLLVIAEEAMEKEEPDPATVPSLGYKIYSYYKRGVGLVKEFQEDVHGRRLCTMELSDYKVNVPVDVDKEIATIREGKHQEMPSGETKGSTDNMQIAAYEVTNDTEHVLSVFLSGAEKRVLTLNPHTFTLAMVRPDDYEIAARVEDPGVIPFYGKQRLAGGTHYEVRFFIVIR